MKNHHATDRDLKELQKFSMNFELDPIGYMIRQKPKVVNQQLTLLGFDNEGIKNLTKEQFNKFMHIKESVENLILSQTPIIITTCKSFGSRRLRNYRFRKVIVDEAAQAQEVETLLPMREAEQVVLIGDHRGHYQS